MATQHTLTPRDKWFLERRMRDPVTHEPFKAGDTVVICAQCKTAYSDGVWAMSGGKCCQMGCNHERLLSFSRFSPVIFQPRATRSARFRIAVPKLPVVERLRLLNGYPAAMVVTAAAPLLAVGLLIYGNIEPVEPIIPNAGPLTMTLENFAALGGESLEKLAAIDVDFGDMGAKLAAPARAWEALGPEAEPNASEDRLAPAAARLDGVSDRAGDALSRWFGNFAQRIGSLWRD